AFQSSVGRVARFAFLEYDLDTVDAAVSLVDKPVVVNFAVNVGHPTHCVHASSISEHRDELFVLCEDWCDSDKRQKSSSPRPTNFPIHSLPLRPVATIVVRRRQ